MRYLCPSVRDPQNFVLRVFLYFEKTSTERLIRILGEPTRTYKDRIFRMLLSDRKTALEVYNAMNDSDYDNPDELVFTTLKNAVYMGMKNDVSFIISSQLVRMNINHRSIQICR